MSDPPSPDTWPSYATAAKDNIFALGLAMVNYARLEQAFVCILANVCDLSLQLATILAEKTNNNTRLQLARIAISSLDWEKDIIEYIEYFLSAFDELTDNRNALGHSAANFLQPGVVILYRTTKTGNTVACQPTLSEIRQVADDMENYRLFGIEISNFIFGQYLRHHDSNFPQPLFSSLPEKPPRPHKLHYTQDPFPIRYPHRNPNTTPRP